MKQEITLDKNVGAIMKLDCVRGCSKDKNGNLIYVLRRHNGELYSANEGEVLEINEIGDWRIRKPSVFERAADKLMKDYEKAQRRSPKMILDNIKRDFESFCDALDDMITEK